MCFLLLSHHGLVLTNPIIHTDQCTLNLSGTSQIRSHSAKDGKTLLKLFIF